MISSTVAIPAAKVRHAVRTPKSKLFSFQLSKRISKTIQSAEDSELQLLDLADHNRCLSQPTAASLSLCTVHCCCTASYDYLAATVHMQLYDLYDIGIDTISILPYIAVQLYFFLVCAISRIDFHYYIIILPSFVLCIVL